MPACCEGYVVTNKAAHVFSRSPLVSVVSMLYMFSCWRCNLHMNGTRRFVIYEKGIEEDVDIVSPMEVGGIKSPEYLQMNPHGKVRRRTDRPTPTPCAQRKN